MTQVLEKPTHKVIRKQVMRVLPYIDGSIENMGLTRYGLVLVDGAYYLEELACLEQNGVLRYLTGLNEFAPEIQKIENKDEKAAAIKDIRQKVAFLEKSFGANELKVDDGEFWSKVKTVHPTNYKFWKTILIKVGNEPLFLDPENPNDLILICAIEAGGFQSIAKSYEDARMMSRIPKFYLDKATSTAATKNEEKRIKNEAGGLLNELYKKDAKKLFYLVKNIDKNSHVYRSDTAKDIIYDYLDSYISGGSFERSVKKASTNFINLCSLPPEDLRIKAILADAIFYKHVQTKGDGLIYHTKRDVMMGRNVEELVKWCKNPVNADIWDEILKDVEKEWNS